MKQLEGAYLYRFNHPELAQFSSGVSVIVNQANVDEATFKAPFTAAYNNFKQLYVRSPERFGESLREIDQSNDRNWVGTITQVRNMVNHPNPDRARAARHVLSVIEDLPNPTHFGYKKQYGLLMKFKEAFSKIPREELVLATVDEWVDALNDGCNAFESLQANRAAAEAANIKGATAKAKEELIAAYNHLCDQIEATLFLHPDDNIQALFDHLNEYVKNSKIGMRKKKIKGNEDDKPNDESKETAAETDAANKDNAASDTSTTQAPQA